MNSQIVWNGEQDRPLTLCRPCECGCDERDGESGVGYLTGSDEDGNGFSIWIEDESVYQRLAAVLTVEALQVQA